MAKREKNDSGGVGTAVKERSSPKKVGTMDQVLHAIEQPEGKKQRRLIFKKKRGGQVLTREQVTAIKAGRKLLKKELKERGLKGREELDVMASAMGLYFDKGFLIPFLRGMLTGRGLLALAGALAALLGALFLYSAVTQMRGHFTISMSDSMFKEGFVLSERSTFDQPTTHLFSTPAEEVPCVSINHIPANVDQVDGSHNDTYFAYTFYLRNEGESTVGYNWQLMLNSESLRLSDAAWVMLFEDGEMLIYAKPGDNGGAEALPAFGDNSRGYILPPLMDQSADPDRQYQLIETRGTISYYRVIPQSFVSDTVVAEGTVLEVPPQETHKYTVVVWLEGDDPDCTNEMIGGHVGMEMKMALITEEEENTFRAKLEGLWENLRFWEKEEENTPTTNPAT